jgi:hypothetical protein
MRAFFVPNRMLSAPRVSAMHVAALLVLLCMAGQLSAAPVQFQIEPPQAESMNKHDVAISQAGSPDAPALRIRFAVGPDYPNVELVPSGGRAWDWEKYGAMVLRIRNPASEPVRFLMRIDDGPDTRGGTVHCKTGSAVAPAGETVTFVLSFSAEADSMASHGMRGAPPVVHLPGAMELAGSGSIEPKHIASFQIFMHHLERETTLEVESIRLIYVPPAAELYDGIVDGFGQYTRADWPGKIHDEAELKAASDAEQKQLAAAPVRPDRDGYGGWSAGPAFPATGFFTTRKVDGKWWLIDPDGKLFFSTGICTVDYREWGTIVTGRERMFTWLPPEGDPLARFYHPLGRVHSGPVSSGRTFSFYAANLYRKYGADYEARWEQTTNARFKSWGFNTLGNWSSEKLEQLHGVPYTASLGVRGAHQRISGGSDYWSTMHDPFDLQFAADAEASFKRLAERIKDDPWCVGYFVDNELSWSGGPGPEHGRYALAYGALSAQANSFAKAAFVALLKRKYQSAAELGQAWGQKIETWQTLEEPFHPNSAPPTDAMKQDMAAFVEAFGVRYFTVVRDALRKHDAHHLYLGCRFSNFTPEEAHAAAAVCDVVSFNVYQPRLASPQWSFAKDLGKPCIIGEFHVGALDRGMFHPGLVAAVDQRERAAIYKQFVESVADNPAFVGCHWFDYIDEPLTGRWFDGENYNIGFVTVTDTPYPEMVAAAREVNGRLYSRRAGGGGAGHEQ